MTTLASSKPFSESVVMAPRAPSAATLTQKLTLATMVVGIVVLVWDRGREQGAAAETLKQSVSAVAGVQVAFKESTADTRATLDKIQSTLTTVMQSEAGIRSDLLNLNDRVKTLEHRP